MLTVFFRYTCFQGLVVIHWILFYCSWFWNSTWQIPSYTHFLFFHPPHFCTKHWHSGVWRKAAGRKESVASCGRVEAWQFLGWNSNEWPCSFLLPSLSCPPICAGGVGYEGSLVGVFVRRGAILPSRSLPSTTLQQWWDCAACVFVLSLWGVKVLLSFPSSPCLYPTCKTFPSSNISPGNRGARTRGLMERAAASLCVPCQPGWHAWASGIEKAVDIFTGNFSFFSF